MSKPRLITSLLDKILPPDLHHIIGDLEEEFHYTKQKDGIAKARLRFWSQCIRSIPWFILQSLIWNTTMFLNYLKVSWRNIKKHTGFSLINIFGMAASLSVCLLLILFIIDQKSYDRFHENSERIVRVTFESSSSGSMFATTPASLGDILANQYPEVEQTVKVNGGFYGDFRYSEIDVPLSGFYAGQGFLSVFSFELLQGDIETALKEPGSVLLTPESAQKLFGNEDPLGKVITKIGNRDYTVTGIIDNSPKTHFDFEAIASYSTLTADPDRKDYFDNWKNTLWNSYTYLLLDKKAETDIFESKIQQQIDLNYMEEEGSRIARFAVQPITSINLGTMNNNEIGFVIPGVIAWFLIGFTVVITLIACFNYVSLTIARSLSRSKEVGVRKVHGAHRSSVMKQFILESIMIVMFALLFSTFLLQWLLPEFNSLYFINFMKASVDTSLLLQPEVLLVLIAFSVIVGISAGLYPSIYLSSFNPAQVLKGLSNTHNISGQTLKKIITVGQFTFSIIFITTSIMLYLQFNHLVNTDYGFNDEATISIQLKDVQLTQIKNELSANPDVQSVTTVFPIPGTGSTYIEEVSSVTGSEKIEAPSFRVDENFIPTMELNLLAGRNFNPTLSSDSTHSVIITKALMQKLGFDTPVDAINKAIEMTNYDAPVTIAGVVDNFVATDITSTNDPSILLFQPKKSRFALIKMQPGKTVGFVNELESLWENMNSAFPLHYTILNEELRNNPSLSVFIDMIKILGLMAVFSVFISCLGLLGLAIYSSENRVKEIGIRKVLGASVNQLVLTLSKEYLWMIAIAVLISIPASWFINSLWLQTMSNKAEFGLSVHLFGALLATVLALLTISSQTYRSAKTNPVSNLRSE
ncbi:ABC transporter permease [Gracilimonas sp.]|uniref:ABC transporter permease n=1 Tax=Gracilimonas sp. TaxID=1974203 RepID=UPI0028726F10|nr:FtsX-like permease family protein [Gracilimonas sp.]